MEENQSEFMSPKGHLARLKKGSLLLSVPTMEDPHFLETLVLVCHYTEIGAYGLVLNRASHMPLNEIFNALDGYQKAVKKVFVGGPVQTEELQIVQITDNPVVDSVEITPGVFLGGNWQDFAKILQEDPQNLRLFLGYSGWGPGQLEAEIRAGSWEVYQAPLSVLLNQAVDPWDKLGFAGLRDYLIQETNRR